MTRLVAISDTHGRHTQMLYPIPDGDILIIAGDFTAHGRIDESKIFNDWLGTLPHKHKLIIAGNHDWVCYNSKEEFLYVMTNAIYLEDEEITIDGIKFYGSPWTPNYYDWAFMLPRQSKEMFNVWRKIPDNTDVLITHGPPYHILDKALDEQKAGCEVLARRIRKLNLKSHVFGHIHEGYAKKGIHHNVSICNAQYEPVNPPTVINI